MVMTLTIYWDLIAFLNFSIDFLLLLTVNITLKRNVSLKRIAIGSFIGSITLLFLFLPISSITLFFIKIITSFLICLTTFGYQNRKYTIQNMLYFYMTGTILGGFLYYLNVEFSYKREGIIFFHHGLSINYLFLLITSPIVLYTYIRMMKKNKSQYQHYYELKVTFKNNQEIKLNAFLDTGNKLIDPITNKAIILIEKDTLKNKVNIRSPIYVPYKSLNNHGLLKCISPKFIEIEGIKTQKYLIGISEEKFHIDGIQCILNAKCLEDLPC